MKPLLLRARWALVLMAIASVLGAVPAYAQCGEDPACGRPVCDPCFSPCWTARAGIVAMERARPEAAVLVTDSFAPGGTLLVDASDHRFGFELGPDLTIIRHGANWDLEFRWFQVHDWIAATPTITSANGAVVQFVTPIGNTFFPSQVSSRYLSWLDSFELNLKKPVTGWMNVLAGFRYVQLNEQGLAITQDIGPGLNTATYAIDATNGLYGFQIGVDGRLWDRGGRFHLDGFLKAGIYGDDARNRVTITQTVGPSFGSTAAVTHGAFVGELGLNAVYQVNEHFSLMAGYQLAWIEGVAVASEQVAVSDPANGLGGIDTTGSPFYHGFTAAAEFRW